VKTAIRKYLSGACLGIALLCARLAGAYTVPPTAPAWSASGSYSVSWTYQCTNNCASQWLEEKTAAGTFAAVAGGPPKAYAGKPVGQYTYRLARLMRVYAYYVVEYSTEVTVYVQPTAPAVDPLLTQRGYQYQTRVGDIDYDGRRDLFIQRVAGGVANNGVLDTVIVQQTSTPGQYLLVPPSPAQAATAATWPVSSAQVAVEDINVDGFVDVTVKGVANALGVAGARNLIVYSPGQVFNKAPKGIRVVDDGLLKFVGNMLDYQVDQNYFDNYASYTYFYVGSYWSTCGGGPVITNDPILTGSTPGCIWVYQFTSGYFPDYSVFSSAAVAIALAAENADTGQTSTTAAVDAIDRAAEDVFKIQIGGWNMEEVLGSTGDHTNPDARRAMEVVWAILGAARADAQEVPTVEAPPQNPRTFGTVYVTGHRIFAFGPIHSAVEYTSVYTPVTTISAGPEGALPYLVSRVNRPSDIAALNMVLGTVSDPQNPSAEAYFAELLGADARYGDDLWYKAIPVLPGQYNSNSYVRGIIDATGGIPTINLSILVGGGRPVPVSSFR
jgi:hypothetical protein